MGDVGAVAVIQEAHSRMLGGHGVLRPGELLQSPLSFLRGPAAGDAMVAELGFRRGEDYAWRSFSQRGTPRITPRATPKGSPQISRSPSAKRLDLSPGGVPLKSGPGGSNGNTPPRADGLPPRSPARGLAPSP